MLDPEDIEDAFVPAVRPEVVWEELDDEVVIYNGTTKSLHVLDPIASAVWGCFDGCRDIHAVAVRLADAFLADLAVVKSDVLDIIRVLGRQGLLVGVRADPDTVRESRVVAVAGREAQMEH